MLRVITSSVQFHALSNIFCSQANILPENCIDDTSTGVSYYDDFLDDKLKDYFKKNKNLEGHIEYMTPIQYYEECAKIFNSTVDRLKKQRDSDKKSINWLTDALESGQKFHMPYINYANAGQEGLHRMMVIANKYGWDKYTFPVLVVNYVDSRLQESNEACNILSKAVKESLEYKYEESTLPDYLLSQIQFELDSLCEYEDFSYECVCISDDDNSIVVSVKGFESDVNVKILKEDIQYKEPDNEDYKGIDLDNLDDLDLLDDMDIDEILKSIRK